MASLVLKMSVSLDGYVAPIDGSTDWVAAGRSDDGASWTVETLSNAGAHLMGATTYAGWAAYWPGASGPFAKALNEIPKVVFSDSLASADWGEATVVTGDLAAAITRLKQERSGGYLLAHGGVRFARSLVETGLIDEYRLVIHPVVLGAGERIFFTPLTIEPLSTTVFSGGAVADVFRRTHDRADGNGGGSDSALHQDRGGSNVTGRLDGKVAIITGASTGLGPVMAAMFVREGAKVLLAARREELVQEAAAAAGGGAIAMRADVTNEDDVAAMVGRAVGEFGHVDVMCNNAAAPGTDLWIWEQTLENWNSTIAIDITAAMLCTREVLKQSMLERRSGVILNFSSTAGYNGIVRKSHYVTAKASLRAFTKAVALEVGPHGIRCNCVVPGGIDTELWRNWVGRMAAEQGVDEAKLRERMLQGVALRDISTPEDVANLALFLASDESRTITGQSIPVDAGGVMQG